jgi:hypothetical protein
MENKGKSIKDYAMCSTSAKHAPVIQECTPEYFEKYCAQKYK